VALETVRVGDAFAAPDAPPYRVTVILIMKREITVKSAQIDIEYKSMVSDHVRGQEWLGPLALFYYDRTERTLTTSLLGFSILL
jgi:hypothetical protein